MKDLTAAQIIELIEAPHETSIVPFIRAHASIKEIRTALKTASSSHLRQVLCDILGYRQAKSGVSLLIEALDDPDMRVRCSAAESLGKIGESRAGAALFARLLVATELAEMTSLIVALGAVHHQPAIPLLINYIGADHENLRGCAAWSLGELRAKEALSVLKQALAVEHKTYPRQRLQEAIHIIAAL